MTPTETVAVKLLGWEEAPDEFQQGKPLFTRYFLNRNPNELEEIDPTYGTSVNELEDRNPNWPDLTTFDGCHRFEEALRERGLIYAYSRRLHATIPDDDRVDLTVDALMATTAQRVAACIEVLNHIETEAVKKAQQDEKSHARAAQLLAIAKDLKKTMQCNCDLDNWEPERSTGHSCVCRIHKAALQAIGKVPL